MLFRSDALEKSIGMHDTLWFEVEYNESTGISTDLKIDYIECTVLDISGPGIDKNTTDEYKLALIENYMSNPTMVERVRVALEVVIEVWSEA